MKGISLSPEEFAKHVLDNLLNTDSGLARFNHLLKLAGLEKDLLQISSYESAEFIVKSENIEQMDQPKIDRLTLVYPISYAFSVDYRISGFFSVKYKQATNPLPTQVEPFTINYSGILIPNEMEFNLKNEKIALIHS
jgi:hypothetical protein